MPRAPGRLRMPLPWAWWLFGVAVLAALALRPWLGDEIFLTRYTGYVMPWLLVPLLPGAATAWLVRRRLLGTLLCASAAIVAFHQAHLFRGRSDAPAAQGAATLRVMSYNTWSRNADAPRIAAVVLRYRPDVLLLQEIPAQVLDDVASELRRRGLYGGAPVHVAYEAALLQAVVSRHPVASSKGAKHRGNAQRVVLRSPHGPLAVYNVHPPRFGGWRHRYRQIAALLEEDVARETGPVVVGGDFNAPDHSELYRLLASRLSNAHEAAGAGLGFTFPAALAWRGAAFAALPLVRIDHVFVTGHFVTLRAGTLADAGGSDHRPVYAEVALIGAPASPEQGSAGRGAPGGASGG